MDKNTGLASYSCSCSCSSFEVGGIVVTDYNSTPCRSIHGQSDPDLAADLMWLFVAVEQALLVRPCP